MPEIRDVLKEVLKDIVPKKEERRRTEKLCEKIKKSFQRISKGFAVESMFCGSVAKDTWLAGNKDIDMFILFSPATKRDYLEKHGLALGKEVIEDLGGRWGIAYAEHPYIRGFVNNHRVEIVPAYKVKAGSELKSAVDRTPYHVRYVNKNLNQTLTKDVRLLKKFCKGIGVYGSDLKTRGFSGYLCELLIIEYGTFLNLIKKAKNWMAGVCIDPKGYYEKKEKMREMFPEDALIMIDPVDKNRNVASVLSAENFFLFIKKCKEFLEEPSREFFSELEGEAPEPEEIKKYMDRRDTDFILIKFRAPVTHQDVLWPQLRKLKRRVVDMLEDKDFEVLRSDVWSDGVKCIIILELLEKELASVQKRRGPSIFDREGTKGFWKRYKGYNIFVEDNKWFVEYPREYKRAINLLKNFFDKDYEELAEQGVPRKLAEQIKKKIEIKEENQAYRFVKMYKDLRRFLERYFEKKLI